MSLLDNDSSVDAKYPGIANRLGVFFAQVDIWTTHKVANLQKEDYYLAVIKTANGPSFI